MIDSQNRHAQLLQQLQLLHGGLDAELAVAICAMLGH